MKISRLLWIGGALGFLLPYGSLRATPLEYTATLLGAAESPPNASPGTGFADVFYDGTAHTLRVIITFSDLLGATTASHIHAPTVTPFTGTAGVATTTPSFTGFPLGVTSGSYDHTFDLTLASSFNPAFVTANGGTTGGAETALAAALLNGKAYLNIHSDVFAGGEIRGFLATVPDSASTASLLLLSIALLAGYAGWARRRRNDLSADGVAGIE